MVRLPIDASPLLISIATTCAATAATFFLGLLAAWWMYRAQGDSRAWGARTWGLWGWGLRTLGLRGWIDGLLTLPLVLPPTVVGFFLLLVFGRRSLLGAALERVGITIVFSWPATVIAATVVAFPLMYRTALGAFEQVNPTLLQAARTLGASEWRVFRRILFPLAGPGVVAGTVLAFARAMGEFGATLMLAGNIPGRTQTMPIAIFSAVEDGDMRLAAVWVTLIVAISLGMIRLLNREGRAARRRVQTEVAATAQIDAGELPTVPRAALAQNEESETPSALEIDLEKRLERFTLKLRLRAGRGAVGILGPSGAGKTMTLRLIAGVAEPDAGRIVLNGRVLFDSAAGENVRSARRRIGIVFQDYALFPHMTVEENVGFGLSGLNAEERRRVVARHLERMHIAELAGRMPGEISGGQRQRVAIARCMAIEPDALLLDEPFAALDPHLRRRTEEQLRETLAEYKGAVLFVTHDMEEAFRFCSELVVLDGGRVIVSGPKHELFERPRTVVAARLTGCKNIVTARRVGAERIAVDAWQCELRTACPVPDGLTHVGVRSHQIAFATDAAAENTFPSWLMGTSEAPHEMTLYLRLRAPAEGDGPAHMQVDVPKDAARALLQRPQPWLVRLDPARLLLLEG
ncbi:MAG: molybdate ABC transporter permease subunit [Acidobacteriaceae bacterium]|jgi:molybdate transport system permease protein